MAAVLHLLTILVTLWVFLVIIVTLITILRDMIEAARWVASILLGLVTVLIVLCMGYIFILLLHLSP